MKALARFVMYPCLLLLLSTPCALALSEADEYRALSLRVLQEKLGDCQERGGCSRELLGLSGITRAVGYILDDANHDLILFGEVETGFPSLRLDDLVVALRNTYLRYAELKGGGYEYLSPYCSLEPDLAVVDSLSRIGTDISEGRDSQEVEDAVRKWRRLCASPQGVRIRGIPFRSHFASVMVEADYDMKKLAVGRARADVEGFSSLADITLQGARDDLLRGGSTRMDSSIGSRFWFYPGTIILLEDTGIVAIDECPVLLLTEESYLSISGSIEGGGKASESAEAFARLFTELYPSLGEKRPVFIELENLFNLLTVSQGMKWKSSPEEAALDLGYLLDRYPVPGMEVARSLPGQSEVKRFEENLEGRVARVWLPFCGGIAMNIRLSGDNFKRDMSGRLARLRKRAIETRPGPGALSWRFRP